MIRRLCYVVVLDLDNEKKMALVAYDYSDNENEEEADEETGASCVEINKNPQVSALKHNQTNKENHGEVSNNVVEITTNKDSAPTTISISENSTTEPVVESSLFVKLPETKRSIGVIEEDQIEDFIPRPKPPKVKEKVKILIPSLSELADIEDDEPVAKKAKPSSKGSGLMSLLPPVKSSVLSTKSFVPNVVANKTKQTRANDKSSTSSSTMIPHVIRTHAEVKKTQLMHKLQGKSLPGSQESDDDDEDDVEIPETFDDEMWQKVCGRSKPTSAIIEHNGPEQPMFVEPVNIAPEPEKPYDGLDNKAFKELVGRTKRPIGNIKLIDINEEDVLPERELWMTKALTDPEMEPKKEAENPVDPTRRRKHHITYLAQQAKANEQELQNSWASSKNNRMMSRAKYGF
ncbi:unnamed protein product [Acanthoscelides obtectus]|uniref:Proline-rich protein PRCC n=1 Tax=Acanthoscelides obtectus TaxID=200917 RepID=A0A9P0NWB7_ACAOB|nr:unnamed protein product [Acanthoscelides obtectus]CAK1672889.1 Proline-rich protein PRCC [Acanthoscelides obtectus]